MAANNVHVSDELLAVLQSKAVMSKGLEEQSWQDLLAYGRERGRASGYTEEDVPRM